MENRNEEKKINATELATVAGGGISSACTVRVPIVVGHELDEALSQIHNVGLRTEVINITSDKPKGVVISTNPMGGERVDLASKVQLFVSN